MNHIIAFVVGGLSLLISIFAFYNAYNIVMAKSNATTEGLAKSAREAGNVIPLWFCVLHAQEFGPVYVFMNSETTEACDDVFTGMTAQLLPLNGAWENGKNFSYSDFEGLTPDGGVTLTKVCKTSRGTAAPYTVVASFDYNKEKVPGKYGMIKAGLNGDICWPGMKDGWTEELNCPDATMPDFSYVINCPTGKGCFALNEATVAKSEDLFGNIYAAIKLNEVQDGPREGWKRYSLEIGFVCLLLGIGGLIAGCKLIPSGDATEDGTEMLNNQS